MNSLVPDGRPSGPTRVVILGGGFGGIYAARELEKILATRSDLERGGYVPREKENWDSYAVEVENEDVARG